MIRTHVPDYDRLPEPDKNGNYWLGRRGLAPAIFVIGDPKHPKCGWWFPCPASGSGGDGMVPFHGKFILGFDSPQGALEWLRRDANRRERGQTSC